MDRRTFLKGLVATAVGVLVPGEVLAEPERRVWALDQTMVQPSSFFLGKPMDIKPFGVVTRPSSIEEM